MIKQIHQPKPINARTWFSRHCLEFICKNRLQQPQCYLTTAAERNKMNIISLQSRSQLSPRLMERYTDLFGLHVAETVVRHVMTDFILLANKQVSTKEPRTQIKQNKIRM